MKAIKYAHYAPRICKHMVRVDCLALASTKINKPEEGGEAER